MKQALSPFVVFSIVFAMLVWGSWAYYVNGFGSVGLRAAALQAVYSGLMTLYMSFSVMFFFKKARSVFSKFLFPWLGTMGHTGAALIAAHYFGKTPNLWETVSLPLVFGSLYCFLLSYQFLKRTTVSQ